MKITINGNDVFELTETQCKVIQNDIPSEIFDKDMARRTKWVIQHKYDQCFKKLKHEWEPKLKERVESFPSSDREFAKLVFEQGDYESRSQRDEKIKKQQSLNHRNG